MSQSDTKQRIVSELRTTDKPALSAQMLAEELDVSVRTINNHIDELVAEERIQTSQIGNATAYYVPFSDQHFFDKPDHACVRCGRAVHTAYDHAKIEFTTYFENGNTSPEEADFHVFCRFCFSDFTDWVYQDTESIGDYPYVHGWDLPGDQLEQVREDDDVITAPDPEYLTGASKFVYQFVKGKENDHEDGVPKDEIIEAGEEDGYYDFKLEKAITTLKRGGFIHQPRWDYYVLPE